LSTDDTTGRYSGEMSKAIRYRRTALYTALFLALILLILDRTALYLHRPDPDSRAVVVYTAEWCPYCRNLRAYLDNNGIPFTDYDVEKTFKGGMGFWALRGTGVPVSAVGPDIVYGYDLDKINESLARLGYRINGAQNSNALDRGAVFDRK